MKNFTYILVLATLLLSGCTTLEEGGGKIGPDYWDDEALRGTRLQKAHSNLQRGG